MKVTIAPSILSANFGELSLEVQRVVDAGAHWIHLDVMDGQFVPNITFGPAVIQCLEKPQGAFFDAHLMIQNPEQQIEAFAKAGVDLITVHAEATHHLHRVIQQIHQAGCKAGVSLNPATPLGVLDHVYDDIDLVLLMSVNPGWGGQSYIPAITQKIQRLRQQLNEQKNRDIILQVDGGVNVNTIQEIVHAGATNLVAGSAIFSTEHSVDAYQQRIHALLAQVI